MSAILLDRRLGHLLDATLCQPILLLGESDKPPKCPTVRAYVTVWVVMRDEKNKDESLEESISAKKETVMV